MNPWKPPSGWDQVEGERAREPWTARGVLRSMLRAFRRQPLRAFLAVFLLPGLWTAASTVVEKRLVPVEPFALDLEQALKNLGVSLASYAWNSVSGAAQLSAALDVVRDQPIRWRAFAKSVVRAPFLFVTTLVVVLPVELAFIASITTDMRPMALLIPALVILPASLLMFWVMIRTLLWAPLVVDTRRSLWDGLVTSLAWTSGRFWKLLAVLLIVTCFAVPLFGVEWLVWGELWHVSTAALGALSALCVAQIYSDTLSSRASSATDAPISASPNPGS